MAPRAIPSASSSSSSSSNSSESEPESDSQPPSIPSLQKALQKSQEHVSKQNQQIKLLEGEVQGLRAQLATSTTVLTSLSNKGKKHSTLSTLEGRDQIQSLGKKFCMTECPWLDGEIFDLQNTFQGDTQSGARFSSKTSYDEGTRTVLHLMVPEKLWADMVSAPDSRKFFTDGVKSQHSTALSAALAHAAEIFGIGESDSYVRSFDRAGDIRFIGLLSTTARVPGPKRPALEMPFMYPDCLKIPTNLFRTLILVKILRIILWGPKSINKRQRGGKKPAKYILSSDHQLDQVGTSTGFDYVTDHRQMVQLILATQGSGSMKANIAWLNQEIFDEPELNAADDNGDADDEEVDTLARLIGEYTLADKAHTQPTVDAPPPPVNIPVAASTSRAPAVPRISWQTPPIAGPLALDGSDAEVEILESAPRKSKPKSTKKPKSTSAPAARAEAESAVPVKRSTRRKL
ncbi:hypothetical protein FIBSPDRAFT_897441 [Athelia psychrophila]|uniref:Uncharacterized protein n=1 Tax=Athelia psychrophila TaxID=1759441 RepID=A0A166C930_9AGAM|nr:hypothetical protein FIBSPDRAFT_897441 [Fibularhizoctonia sp. CBS 109695]